MKLNFFSLLILLTFNAIGQKSSFFDILLENDIYEYEISTLRYEDGNITDSTKSIFYLNKLGQLEEVVNTDVRFYTYNKDTLIEEISAYNRITDEETSSKTFKYYKNKNKKETIEYSNGDLKAIEKYDQNGFLVSKHLYNDGDNYSNSYFDNDDTGLILFSEETREKSDTQIEYFYDENKSLTNKICIHNDKLLYETFIHYNKEGKEVSSHSRNFDDNKIRTVKINEYDNENLLVKKKFIYRIIEIEEHNDDEPLTFENQIIGKYNLTLFQYYDNKLPKLVEHLNEKEKTLEIRYNYMLTK